MGRYAYCVTGFARPTKVRKCIESINRMDPLTPILLFVDRATDATADILCANQNLIGSCNKWKTEGIILDFKISAKNLRTKNACYSALEWSLNQFEFVVLIEDDLILISSPCDYLTKSTMLMEKDASIGMACLYSSRNHLIQSISGVRITKWPEMWGNLISRNQFKEISTYTLNFDRRSTQIVVDKFSNNSCVGILTRVFKKRFRKTWEFKFNKAIASEFAWDTEWQLGLWSLGKYALAPQKSLVADTGVDTSSVSPLKGDSTTLNCGFQSFTSRLGLPMCKSCETRREHQNHTIPEKFFELPYLGPLIKEGLL